MKWSKGRVRLCSDLEHEALVVRVRLCVCGGDRLTGDALLSLCQLSHLRELDLSWIMTVNDELVRAVARSCPQLSRLLLEVRAKPRGLIR